MGVETKSYDALVENNQENGIFLDSKLKIGALKLSVDAKVEGGKVIEILQDIEQGGFYGSEFEDANFSEKIRTFTDKDISVNWLPYEARDGEDEPGWLIINKEDLNKAIQEGRINIIRGADGLLSIQ